MRIALLAAALLLAACSKAPDARGPLTVLRFDNLTGDPALDWMSRGAARQIASQIDGAAVADLPTSLADRERAIAGGSTLFVHGYIDRVAGRLRLHAEVEDAQARRFRPAQATGAGLTALADSVARQIDPKAQARGAGNDRALRAYVEALGAPGPEPAIALLNEAIAADPDFGAAYLASAQAHAQLRDRAGAERIIAAARARKLSPADRARLDVTAAQLGDDSAALTNSLAELSKLNPNDAGLLRSLASAELTARRFPRAIEYLNKALAAQPGDPVTLNSLGYAYAYAGDLDAAIRALREYERSRPAEANPLDSLAEVHFYHNRFAESADLYRQAYERDANFQSGSTLFRSAVAQLFAGDAAAADRTFAQYGAARKAVNDPMAPLALARWDYLRGRRAEAMRALAAFITPSAPGEAVALADCTLTIWLLESGDRAGAAKRKACVSVTTGGAGQFPSPLMRALSLLLAGKFAEALPVLRQIEQRTAPQPTDPVPALTGWALMETGKAQEAKAYLRYTPSPSAAPAPYEALIYPRVFELRKR